MDTNRHHPAAAERSDRTLTDKGYLYRVLVNRVYRGDAVHKGKAYPGEHQAIIGEQLWDQVHAILRQNPRKRANNTRAQAPALLKGLIFTAMHGDRARHALDERPFWARRDARRAGGARTNSIAQWIVKCLLLGIKRQVTNTSDVSLAAIASGHSSVTGVYLGEAGRGLFLPELGPERHIRS